MPKRTKAVWNWKVIEGVLHEPMDCVVIEDVITSGQSINEVVAKLQTEKKSTRDRFCGTLES